MHPDQQLVQLTAVISIFLAFGIGEVLIGKFFAPEAGREDNRLDVAVGIMFPLVSGSVFTAGRALGAWLLPEMRDAWADWPLWAMIGTLLIADDLTQYWWHRLSHTSVMWPLHRAHHSASYMSVRVVYRNNLFYYAMMPGLWFGGLLLYLGFGWTFVWYSVVKLLVIIGAHSAVRWDQWWYHRSSVRSCARRGGRRCRVTRRTGGRIDRAGGVGSSCASPTEPRPGPGGTLMVPPSRRATFASTRGRPAVVAAQRPDRSHPRR